MTSILRRSLIPLLALSFFLELQPVPLVLAGLGVSDAEARIGRPGTPRSVAGVARRTTRRVVRRTSAYYSTLPAGCGRYTLYGAAVWNCGGVYYQPHGNQYVIVVVD